MNCDCGPSYLLLARLEQKPDAYQRYNSPLDRAKLATLIAIGLAMMYCGSPRGTAQTGSNDLPATPFALLPESWARTSAINSVIPTYSEEALRRGIEGIVRIRFETTPKGEVVRIKVKPRTDSLLTKAVVDAVKNVRYKPWPGPNGSTQVVLSRLAFRFVIEAGLGRVEMYEPRLQSDECLSCSNTKTKEMLEWRNWREAWSKDVPKE